MEWNGSAVGAGPGGARVGLDGTGEGRNGSRGWGRPGAAWRGRERRGRERFGRLAT